MSVLDELIKRASTNKAWAAAAELDRLRSEKQELRQILGDLIKIFSSTDVAFFGEEQSKVGDFHALIERANLILARKE